MLYKIVHLNSRPTQLYYQGVPSAFNNKSTIHQICEVRVPINDVYATIDDSNKPYIDLFFYCSGWCCGIDCCQINVTLVLAIGCIGFLICAVLINVVIRKLCQRLLMFRALRRFHLGRKKRKRIMMRTNAQRWHFKESHHFGEKFQQQNTKKSIPNSIDENNSLKQSHPIIIITETDIDQAPINFTSIISQSHNAKACTEQY